MISEMESEGFSLVEVDDDLCLRSRFAVSLNRFGL